MFDELFVVGGPQGRFLIEENDGEIEVTNQIDCVFKKGGFHRDYLIFVESFEEKFFTAKGNIEIK